MHVQNIDPEQCTLELYDRVQFGCKLEQIVSEWVFLSRNAPVWLQFDYMLIDRDARIQLS